VRHPLPCHHFMPPLTCICLCWQATQLNDNSCLHSVSRAAVIQSSTHSNMNHMISITRCTSTPCLEKPAPSVHANPHTRQHVPTATLARTHLQRVSNHIARHTCVNVQPFHAKNQHSNNQTCMQSCPCLCHQLDMSDLNRMPNI
jgi:hypothetical protein